MGDLKLIEPIMEEFPLHAYYVDSKSLGKFSKLSDDFDYISRTKRMF